MILEVIPALICVAGVIIAIVGVVGLVLLLSQIRVKRPDLPTDSPTLSDRILQVLEGPGIETPSLPSTELEHFPDIVEATPEIDVIELAPATEKNGEQYVPEEPHWPDITENDAGQSASPEVAPSPVSDSMQPVTPRPPQKYHETKNVVRRPPTHSRRLFTPPPSPTPKPHPSRVDTSRFDIDPGIPAYRLERELRDRFEGVQFIGQLPIDKEAFRNICHIIQREAIHQGRLLYDRVPHGVLVTSMVFTARYSEEYARNFWQPYARSVWGQGEASQNFQNQCRRRFVSAVSDLSRECGLWFPRETYGDVVRPVYRHAVIPHYLQDDFANWLKKVWDQIVDLHEDSWHVLFSDTSLRYLPPTLRTFIQDDYTRETAKALMRDMATAARIYVQEGESAENIRLLLATTPIQRALWEDLQQALDEQHESRVHCRKALSPKVQWIWSFEHNDMLIRVTNLLVRSEVKPNRLAWVRRGENPLQASIVEYINPWKDQSGNWFIDEIALSYESSSNSHGKPDGNVVLLAEDDAVLESLLIPDLPKAPVAIFRSTQQNVYGIEVDYRQQPITDGYWVISMKDNVELIDADEQVITPHEARPVPLLLARYAGHKQAGIYHLKLPITIHIAGAESIELERQALSASSPELLGDNNQIERLSPNVPPAFTSRAIWLQLPGVSSRLIAQGALWIKSSEGNRPLLLRELESNGCLQLEADMMTIDLSTLLLDRPAVYVLEVRQGLHPVFPSPLRFSVLPGVTVEPPDPTPIYGPENWPTCCIHGVRADQILSDATMRVSEGEDGIEITWHDLRQPCTLRLGLDNGQIISLMWDVARVFAWIEPAPAEGRALTVDELETTRLNIIAPPQHRHDCHIWVKGEESSPRPIDIGAQGRYSAVIGKDQLYHMILSHQSTTTEVCVEVAGYSWKVFEVQQYSEIDEQSIQPVPPVPLFPSVDSNGPSRRSSRNPIPVMITMSTRFYIDPEWWEQSDMDLWFILEELCGKYAVRKLRGNHKVAIDWIDPVTGCVIQVNPLMYHILTQCNRHPEYITDRLPLVEAVFRALLASGNRPMTAVELAQVTGRSANTILKTLTGREVYRGIRVWLHPEEGNS